ncbi:hypothetical protein D3H65_15970 [Paraflavitalea soli]|uniref:Uncharacterized protein n=1 Tax=Paraflavitalea soli TaxID=2315862 RepID=A0A3B7MQR9_9BACT|nr:hypothetical protein [Paraflavitalea soli]AXY75390.1 hypothetical protein D3H65_15970 [Paraflavitalea soli]
MWENIKDYSFALFGLLLTLVPLIHEVRKSNGFKFTGYIIILIILGLSTIGLTIDKVRRDGKEKNANNQTINNLQMSLDELTAGRKKDSTSFSEFLISLEKKYKILRDSNTNQPIIYNTQIGHADRVNIGQ